MAYEGFRAWLKQSGDTILGIPMKRTAINWGLCWGYFWNLPYIHLDSNPKGTSVGPKFEL